ncbi:MAG: acylneuraminate cytidylyltransferase family protein [Patescibacteria group bacterium]|jgi:N-acylneuraminate cytidylyltransferase
MFSCVALIPARAGSKRVANKNVKLLNGHPLLAYTIVAAKQAGIFTDVIVSTDSKDIAKIAEQYGATVFGLRPAELATDNSPDIKWVQYVLKQLMKPTDAFAILRPTSPFRQVNTIQRAWQEFSTKHVDSIRAVELCKQHPAKMWRVVDDQMEPIMSNPDLTATPWHSSPYQTLPKVYAQNASLEIAWCRIPLEQGTISGKFIAPFFTTGYDGFDINLPEDWVVAEYLIKQHLVTLPNIVL